VGLTERLATGVGRLLERRSSRRGMLARSAVAGAALAVGPVDYLVRPGTAWGKLRPHNCRKGSKCKDGYTAFCCEIQNGLNQCPPNSYIAGWWKCTDYRGAGLCNEEGVRYYIDCNRTPGTVFPGGCQCAGGSCAHRRVDCNHFRYGQCNTHVFGATEVVCRLVVCQNPSTVQGMGCNATEKVDNRTCRHEAGCLEGLAVQLPGGGGA
jgi:hypothetical protein